MTSPLTTPFAVMLEDLNAQLETAGYSFDKSHVSLRHHLATALSGLRGSSASELTLGLAELLCSIANASDGGSLTAATEGVSVACARGIDALAGDGGGGGSYTGPLDLVTGASLAFGQRALRSATRGAPLYTIRRSSDDTTQPFSSDATTGGAPVAAIETFVGARFGIADFVLVVAGGSGYDDGATPSTFDVTFSGGTGTPAVMNVSTDGSGAVVVVNSVTNFGNYSVLPSSPNSPTGDDGSHSGTGLQISCHFALMAFVSTWNDQSGNSKSATQATAINQPLWLPSATNSLPGVGFSSIFAQALNTGDVTFASSDYTVFCVLAVSVPNEGNGTVLSANGSDNGPDFGMQVFGGSTTSPTFFSDDEGYNNGNGGQLDGSAISDVVYYVLDASWGSATPLVGSLNGTALSLTTDFTYGDGTSAPATMPIAIGSSDVLAPNNWLTGTVLELIVYNKLVADRAPIRQNMAAYYGITLT